MSEARPERPHRERAPREEAPILYVSEPDEAPSGPVRVVTSGYQLAGAITATLRVLRQDGIPAKLAAGDATLWGDAAEAEARIRLGWLSLPESSRELLPRLDALRAELGSEGVDRVVLCGMGGSSLAPEVICAAGGRPLVVLDSTDAQQVRAALVDLDRTVVVVASKSGSTVETDSQRRVFAEAFEAASIDVASRFVAVTDPGSALAELAESESWRAVFLADPLVGGRYSALSAFGLVPSALAGVDVAPLLEDAASALPDLARDRGNPGLDLGAALGGAAKAGRDKVLLVAGADAAPGFGDWAEQLLAESTGKSDRGLVPVVLETDATAAAVTATNDVHPVVIGGPAPKAGTSVVGPLGAQFLVWEYATAIAGRVLDVNPFDQPDVESAKTSTRELLDAGIDSAATGEPAFVDGDVEVHGDAAVLADASTVADVVTRLLATVPPTGYLAVHAYLDRHADADVALLRQRLAGRTARPVTFGWGPRFLHSTGQLHKGGAPVGVFLQLTGVVDTDLAIPGRPFTFGELQLAQALGDGRVLTARGRPVVRLHLRARDKGIAQLLAALAEPAE